LVKDRERSFDERVSPIKKDYEEGCPEKALMSMMVGTRTSVGGKKILLQKTTKTQHQWFKSERSEGHDIKRA